MYNERPLKCHHMGQYLWLANKMESFSFIDPLETLYHIPIYKFSFQIYKFLFT